MADILAPEIVSELGEGPIWSDGRLYWWDREATDRARDIWAEARLVFADQPAALEAVDTAARGLGFTE